jgi:uncharacterized membrane protein
LERRGRQRWRRYNTSVTDGPHLVLLGFVVSVLFSIVLSFTLAQGIGIQVGCFDVGVFVFVVVVIVILVVVIVAIVVAFFFDVPRLVAVERAHLAHRRGDSARRVQRRGEWGSAGERDARCFRCRVDWRRDVVWSLRSHLICGHR